MAVSTMRAITVAMAAPRTAHGREAELAKDENVVQPYIHHKRGGGGDHAHMRGFHAAHGGHQHLRGAKENKGDAQNPEIRGAFGDHQGIADEYADDLPREERAEHGENRADGHGELHPHAGDAANAGRFALAPVLRAEDRDRHADAVGEHLQTASVSVNRCRPPETAKSPSLLTMRLSASETRKVMRFCSATGDRQMDQIPVVVAVAGKYLLHGAHLAFSRLRALRVAQVFAVARAFSFQLFPNAIKTACRSVPQGHSPLFLFTKNGLVRFLTHNYCVVKTNY